MEKICLSERIEEKSFPSQTTENGVPRRRTHDIAVVKNAKVKVIANEPLEDPISKEKLCNCSRCVKKYGGVFRLGEEKVGVPDLMCCALCRECVKSASKSYPFR
jgi:hypothetical protein